VSYDAKHNEANGEDNRDGATDQPVLETPAPRVPHRMLPVLALRAQRSRAMLCTLLLSSGVPMLLGGDELGRTQGGNNNAYCQDKRDLLGRLVRSGTPGCSISSGAWWRCAGRTRFSADTGPHRVEAAGSAGSYPVRDAR